MKKKITVNRYVSIILYRQHFNTKSDKLMISDKEESTKILIPSELLGNYNTYTD